MDLCELVQGSGIGAREYDAALGRFLSADPLIDVMDPQQMQGYSYANNNPITRLDPSGLGFFSWVADRAKDTWDFVDAHTGTIGLALGVAGMIFTTGGLDAVVLVAGLVVNAYDGYKSARDGDDVGFGLAIAGFVAGGTARVLGKVSEFAEAAAGAATARSMGTAGMGVTSDVLGQGAGSASAGMAEAKNIQTARQEAIDRPIMEARDKAAKLAADIDRMLNSGCPAMKGVVPLPGPCPVAEGQPDPMKNKYCTDGGSGADFLGCTLFGADWRRLSSNVPGVQADVREDVHVDGGAPAAEGSAARPVPAVLGVPHPGLLGHEVPVIHPGRAVCDE